MGKMRYFVITEPGRGIFCVIGCTESYQIEPKLHEAICEEFDLTSEKVEVSIGNFDYESYVVDFKGYIEGLEYDFEAIRTEIY